MEHTIKRVAQLAGISTRTLRYYDEINLLKPVRINSSGYRIYGQAEIDTLQQIMFYRELDFTLEQIRHIIHEPTFDKVTALQDHRKQLLIKQAKLHKLIHNVEKTIKAQTGGVKMTNEEKFQGFKEAQIQQNEATYGEEMREKFGADAVEQSNQKFMNMSQEAHEKATKLAEEIVEKLKEAVGTVEPSGELGQKIAELHKEWITYYWPKYDKHAHVGLARMYVEDERFASFYNQYKPGAAEFLRDVIEIFVGEME